jgi:hypothetical protein
VYALRKEYIDESRHFALERTLEERENRREREKETERHGIW